MGKKDTEEYTVPVGKAAEMFGVSTKTFIKYAAGISFEWDGRGRRVKMSELNQLLQTGLVQNNNESADDLTYDLMTQESVFYQLAEQQYNRVVKRDKKANFILPNRVLLELAVYRFRPFVKHCGRIYYLDRHYQAGADIHELIRDQFGWGGYKLKPNFRPNKWGFYCWLETFKPQFWYTLRPLQKGTMAADIPLHSLSSLALPDLRCKSDVTTTLNY